MNPPPPIPPKTRADCVIDAKLNPAAADHLAAELERGMSLRAAVRFLQQEHGAVVSESAVSRWAAKRRRARAALAFASLREDLALDKEQAFDLCAQDGAAIEKLFEANVLLAARALFAAQRSGDENRVLKATKIFAAVLGVVTKARQCAVELHDGLEKAIAGAEAAAVHRELAIERNDTRQMNAETTRMRFDFDVDKATKPHLDALYKLNENLAIGQRERIDRAIEAMFRAQERTEGPKGAAAPASP